MTRRHFCTYFDHRYLIQGLALYRSLSATCPDFMLWVLALDEEAETALSRANLSNISVVPLADLEKFDPDLAARKSERSLVEYYFTCSPCLPRYLLQMNPTMESVTYLDSDLFFFSSPEPIFAELSGFSVGIIAHRFSPRSAKSHARYGIYNVGWLTFVRSDDGSACLEWWRARCIEWCFDRLDGERYADQKYLDQFERLFHGIHAITHPGANLAPWNVANYTVSLDGSVAEVDRMPLIFFHFQGLRRISENIYDSNLGGYGARLTPVLSNNVFRPYLLALREAEDFARTIDALPAAGTAIRRRATGLQGFRYAAGRAVRTIKAAITHNLVYL